MASTIATTSPARRETKSKASEGRPWALGLLLILAIIGIAAGSRVALGVFTTPSQLIFVEPIRYVYPDIRVSESVLRRADAAAALITDASLVRARIDHCRPTAGDPPEVDFPRCLAAVDDALRAAPASGELWLVKATLLVQSGDFGPIMIDTLRRSYAVSPHETWIASARVVLGLKLYPLLTQDMRRLVEIDLQNVISDRRYATVLAAAYFNDLTLRESGRPAFDGLPTEVMKRFVLLVGSVSEDAMGGMPNGG